MRQRSGPANTEQSPRVGPRPGSRSPGAAAEREPRLGDARLLRALADPALYPGGADVSLHETHASWVFVAGERAYKVKKPVTLGFLDYGTLERRREACREEVRVNRELAPDIYLGVRAILSTPEGVRFAPEDASGAIEYAVEMRRFDERDTLRGAIASGELTHADVRAVAATLARFHRSAPRAGGGPADVLERWRANVCQLDAMAHPRSWRIGLMEGFGESFVQAHSHEIEHRARAGLVRDGHGDLRCEHVLLRPAVRVVDRIEFDPSLRRCDVAGDLAFLAMDLEAQRQRWAARELVRAYRHAEGDPGSESLRAFHAAHWSLVRAKVALLDPSDRSAQRAERSWRLAERMCWSARRPLAIVICGPPASGKSTLAAELSRRSRLPVVSTDRVRKRRAGIAATDRARAEHYSSGFTHAVYEQVSRDAVARIRARGGVIVDASCRSRAQRALLLRRLRWTGARRLVVRCELPLELAVERAARRMVEPRRVSDATPAIVREGYRSFEPLRELAPQELLELDAELELDEQVAEIARAVDRRAEPWAASLSGG